MSRTAKPAIQGGEGPPATGGGRCHAQDMRTEGRRRPIHRRTVLRPVTSHGGELVNWLRPVMVGSDWL